MDRILNVLIVEDLEVTAKLLTTALPIADPKVRASYVTKLAAAIEQIQRFPPDVVLLDLKLPDADDVDAVLALQTVAPRLPVVVFTGRGEVMQQKALQAGAQDYLIKGKTVTPGVIVRSLRYAVIRNDLLQRYLRAYRSLDNTKQALVDAEKIESKKEFPSEAVRE